ncbi:hypothetical protein FA95DRAFT_1574490 [Auriscalpium vulgare]|uniref:Uncharacterized protein n=1 Tax=Auriscalpium vulgare TaxID=40419 RepID=A0ACB8RK50_9AGAM|nr:hypothetical protein FA95DRAFT_1574490 [Auriscalpium vulgare]
MAARLLVAAPLRAAIRAQPRLVPRRLMSASAHAPKASTDTPWLIGSALVFIPTIGYLLSPAARDTPQKAHAAGGHGSPKVPAETVPHSSEPVTTDDEGTAVSASDVKSSISKAVNEDSPKEAASTEAAGLPEAADTSSSSEKYHDGAPGQTADSEGAHEQKEKPHEEPKLGTVQNEDDTSAKPVSQGAPRELSKKGSSPKEAAESKD